jgi:hypothetical protein
MKKVMLGLVLGMVLLAVNAFDVKSNLQVNDNTGACTQTVNFAGIFSIHGKLFSSTAPTAGQAWVWDDVLQAWKPYTLTKADLLLGNVDNTADSAKSVLYAVTAGSAPASDVYAWAKNATKPTYTKSEVGLGNADNTADSTKSVLYATTAGAAPASDVSAWAKASTKPTYTKSEVGLSNVDNTSDANKPVSTAQATAIGLKVDKVTGKGLSTEDYTTTEKNKLSGIEAGANNYVHPSTHPPSIIVQDSSNRFVSDTEKSTWNGKESAITAGTSLQYWRGDKSWQTLPTTLPASDVYAWAKNATKPTYTKSEVGLDQVDNTSDANKPVSTAQQTALNAKQNLASTRYSKGNISGAVTIDRANGDYQVAVTTAAVTGITISNLTTETGMIIEIDNSGGYSVTYNSTEIVAAADTGRYAVAFYNNNSTIYFMGKGRMY